MYNLMKPLLVREELLKRKIRIFSNQEFARIFGLSSYQAEYGLNRLGKEGLLTRLKKGYYLLKTDPPSDEEIANALYKPSYLSFEYALARYGVIPESPYHLTSATTKPTRVFALDHRAYSYYSIKQEAYTGYYLDVVGNRRVLIAEPEKALADYLYFIAIGKRFWNDRFDVSKLDKGKLIKYVKLFGRMKALILVEGLLW